MSETEATSIITNHVIAIAFVLITIGVETSLQLNISNEVTHTTAELIRSRGYIAKEHKFVTSDGYELTLVQALNPLINGGERGLENKDPILYIPGALSTAKGYVVNSKGAEPKDYGNLDASSLSLEELNDLFGDEPASKSLALLSMNFGHEIWLLNRRGSLESLGHTELRDRPSNRTLENLFHTLFGGFFPVRDDESDSNGLFSNNDNEFVQLYDKYQQSLLNMNTKPINNPKYWNYSLDEQAVIDLPEVIDFVLEKTGRDKLALVGYSAGSALVLMMLSAKPEIAEKITKSILWAPALYLGDSASNPIIDLLRVFLDPALTSYLGPFPTYSFMKVFDAITMTICSVELAQRTLCNIIPDFILGPSGLQQSITPTLLSAMPTAMGSHEYLSLLQSIDKGKMHYIDYLNLDRNMIAYGQPEPPVYNVSRITSTTMTFWTGISDSIVTPKDVERIRNDLSVPAKFTYINGTGFFNHISFLIHNQVKELLIFPSLKVLESG